jgi:hypothetical protein
MGKLTSEQILYGGIDSRVSKALEIRSKPGSKTGAKRGPGQHPKSRKPNETSKSLLQRVLKKGSKNPPKSRESNRNGSNHRKARYTSNFPACECPKVLGTCLLISDRYLADMGTWQIWVLGGYGYADRSPMGSGPTQPGRSQDRRQLKIRD